MTTLNLDRLVSTYQPTCTSRKSTVRSIIDDTSNVQEDSTKDINHGAYVE